MSRNQIDLKHVTMLTSSKTAFRKTLPTFRHFYYGAVTSFSCQSTTCICFERLGLIDEVCHYPNALIDVTCRHQFTSLVSSEVPLQLTF